MKKSFYKTSKASQMIREARIKKGYTQQELGTMLGYEYGYFVGMMENSSSKIPIDLIPKISELLDLNPKKLLKEVMTSRHPSVAKYL
jgi:transcriptional regulator with XRE-family HTH domain